MVEQVFPGEPSPSQPLPLDPVVERTPPKPGWQTTELWFSVAAAVLSALYASGVMTSDRTLAIAGIVAAVLTALGYKVSRTVLKMAGVLLLALAIAGPQLACGNPEARAKNAGGALLGCELPLAVQTALQLKGPLLEALQGALSGDGLKVDREKLKAIAAPLWAPELRCAMEAAIAYARTPQPAQPGAPQSAAFAADPQALGEAWASVRAELAWPEAR